MVVHYRFAVADIADSVSSLELGNRCRYIVTPDKHATAPDLPGSWALLPQEICD